MRKIIFFLMIFFSINIAFAGEMLETCEYKAKFNKCVDAENKLEIDDFICTDTDNSYEMLYQIILDEEFKKLDSVAEQNLEFLEENRDYYFGQKAKKDILDAVDNVEQTYGIYGDLSISYRNLCTVNGGEGNDTIYEKLASCYDSVDISEVKSFVQDGSCQQLAETKLSIYKDISYAVLKINKAQIKDDQDKEMMQDQRSKYEGITDLFLENLNYLERIWKRWTSKTKDANGS